MNQRTASPMRQSETSREELVEVSLADGMVAAGSVWRGDPWRVPVVFLHGGGQTRHAWRRTAERISAQGYTAYTFDARGHGDSTWSPEGDYSVDAFVDDLHHIVAAISAPPVLVGASLGGTTSIIAEGNSPGLAAGIVLADVALEPNVAGKQRIYGFLNAHLDGFESVERAAAAVSAYNGAERAQINTGGLQRNLRRSEDGRWRWHWDPAFVRTEDGRIREHTDPVRMRQAAPMISAPVLVVHGRRSDIVTEREASEMMALLPNAQSVEVDAGHMITGDDNSIFSSELLRFVSDLGLGGLRLVPAIADSHRSGGGRTDR